MMGLLGIGLALILGIGMRIAVVSGVAMMLMMYTAALPPENNPVVDDHIIYALVLIGLLRVNGSQALGFGKSWAETDLVKRYPVLR
jgi:thiosulfate dehydrogenase [quinone] large subunit